MPQKRHFRRPSGPAGPSSVAPSSRTLLHTQELMLFCSPISAAPSKRSASTSKRTACSHFGGGRQGRQPRSSSQHRQTSLSTATHESSDRATVELEPLPENYHLAPCPSSTGFSSSTTLASSANVTASGSGSRIPFPPPQRQAPPAKGAHAAATAAPIAAPVVASGAGSRVIRLLRDARAAVQDPIRPETPFEAFASVPSLSTGASANRHSTGYASASLLARRPGGLESRSQRRLPAGWRLAPMTPPPSAPASDFSDAALEMSGESAAASLATPVTGAGIRGSADFLSSQSGSSPLPLTGTSRPLGRLAAKKDAGNGDADQSLAVAHDHGIDARKFAQLYPVAQQAGDAGNTEAADLLFQLKRWLVSSLHATGSVPALNKAAVECLQTTLLHFCAHWPTGATLRQAVDHYTARGSNTVEVDPNEGSRASTSTATTFAPLLHTQAALLAASIMLQSFPATALVAEPVSFEATLRALHIIAEAGLAEWVALETNALGALVELLRFLVGPGLGTQPQGLHWLESILSTVALCCEDAAGAATTAFHGAPLETGDLSVSRCRHRQHSSGPTAGGSLLPSGYGETDMIRGSGLVEDEAENQQHNTHRRQQLSRFTSTALRSQSSLHPHLHPVDNTSVADAISAGPPLSCTQSGADKAAASASALVPLCSAREEHASLRAQLVSLGFLPTLQQISDQALACCAPSSGNLATSPAADSLASLLTLIVTLYRCFAQSHPEELRGLGVLRTLTSVLNNCATDTATVEAAARALVKLTYVDECLLDMQASTAVIAAAAHALRSQLSRAHADTSQEPAIELLVSRLCGVMARVAEDSTEQQEYLISVPMAQLLEALTLRYVTVSGPADVEPDRFSAPLALPPAPVLQAVVWVLGIASMSPNCPLHLVQSVTPPLVRLLEVLRRIPSMQLTAVYVLMCLSNLSYFFAAFESAEQECAEDEGGGASAWLTPLYSSLGLLLAHYLFEDNVEATVEATRILGNISYTNAGRDWMEANRCDEVAVLFLGHEDLRIVYNCSGVLLNLTAASPCRIVEEPELLQMMLSYTSRYTDKDQIEATAALAEARLHQKLQHRGEDARELTAEASSHTTQIADLVEKLILNVHGLLTLSAL
ncbi:hypothetical protein LSCM4_02528 [Leishmania orientalis]|uniref:Uncharacterized protein n=1 Tax=Leishmania orientalis TaxID=2249476 RepID=A0A836KCW6_9TRYP|nr:hypothetical protein LSCM4_02528 [Leishmania orientalis]